MIACVHRSLCSVSHFGRVSRVKVECGHSAIQFAFARLLGEHALPSLVCLELGEGLSGQQLCAILNAQPRLESLGLTIPSDEVSGLSACPWAAQLCGMQSLHSVQITHVSSSHASTSLACFLIASMPSVRWISADPWVSSARMPSGDRLEELDTARTKSQLADGMGIRECVMIALLKRRLRYGCDPRVAIECIPGSAWLGVTADTPSLLHLVRLELCIATDEQRERLCSFLDEQGRATCQWRRLNLSIRDTSRAIKSPALALLALLLRLPRLEDLRFSLDEAAEVRISDQTSDDEETACEEGARSALRELDVQVLATTRRSTEVDIISLVSTWLVARRSTPMTKVGVHAHSASVSSTVVSRLLKAASGRCEALSLSLPLTSLLAAFKDTSLALACHDLEFFPVAESDNGDMPTAWIFDLAARALRVAPALSTLLFPWLNLTNDGEHWLAALRDLASIVTAHSRLRFLNLPFSDAQGKLLTAAAREAPRMEILVCGSHPVLRNAKRQVQAQKARALWIGVALVARVAAISGSEARYLGDSIVSFLPRIVDLADDDKLSCETETGRLVEKYASRFANSPLCATLAHQPLCVSRKRKHKD